MTFYSRNFHLHRLFTRTSAYPFLERHTDFVPDQVINMRADVLGSLVSPRLLLCELDFLIIWAAALEYVQ